jgi:hypothetical protein
MCLSGNKEMMKDARHTTQGQKDLINRESFIRMVIRAGLVLILGVVAFILSGRISKGNDCSGCPGNGICRGETDCSIFLSENK